MSLIPPDEAELGPEPGWQALNPIKEIAATRNFVHGDDTGERFRVRFYRSEAPQTLFAKAWLGPAAEGPPGHAHGGAILALLDEVLGGTAWASGYKVVLARFESDLKVAVPLGHLLLVRGEIESVDGRKIWVRGQVYDAAGTVFAVARCLFVVLRPEQRAKYLVDAREGHVESPGGLAAQESEPSS